MFLIKGRPWVWEGRPLGLEERNFFFLGVLGIRFTIFVRKPPHFLVI